MSKSNRLQDAGGTAPPHAHERPTAAPDPRRSERRGVRRHALIARALHQPGIRTVVVQAPAGHGKSTLLAQLRVECEQRGDLTGWLDLGDSDNDIRRFHEHLDALIGSLRARRSGVPRTPPRGAREAGSHAEAVTAQLLSLGQPVSLFLDDLHLVSASQTLAFLTQVLQRVPERVQVFIASRTLPDLGLSRRTVTGEALVIRAGELGFTREETARYFASVADLALSGQELELIHRQTDGWPAALQLYRLALRQPLLRRDLQRLGDYPPQELAAYLAENVLRQQSAAVRDFLLPSAVMNRFSAALCDEVLARTDSAEQLAQLEAAGLFLRRLESDPRWFTYHPLFRAFLVDQFGRQGAARVAALRRRAADAFLRQGLMEDALAHSVAAGDHATAAATLERWADALIPAAQLITVEQWSERIAPAEIERRPGLVVKVAWALTFLRRHARLAPLLERLRAMKPEAADGGADPRVVLTMVALLQDDLTQAEHIIGRVEDARAEPGSFRAFELGAACNVRGYVAMAAGDFAAAHQWFGRTRERVERSAASFPWAYSISNSALALIQQGQLHEALALLRKAMDDPRLLVDDSVSQASVVASYVIALYEADALDEAHRLYQRFCEVITQTALSDYVAVSAIVMSRVHDARGEPARALEILDEAESAAYAHRWPRLGTVLAWERVRRELARGECDRAKAVAERAQQAEDGGRGSWVRFSEDAHGATLGRLRLHACCRDPDEALRLIATALASARRKGRVHRQIKLLQFAAIAHHRRKTASRAQQYVLDALRLAAGGGYLRAFLEEGRVLEPLLRANLPAARATLDATPGSPQAVFLDQLAQRLDIRWPAAQAEAASEARAVLDAETSSGERFTPRERSLLRLLSNMASTQEMAQAMRLSRDGLKFHLKNIHAKLGVRTRMEAVRAAQRLGF